MKKSGKAISIILSIFVVLSCIDIRAFAAQIVQDDEYVAMDQDWLTAQMLMNGNTYEEKTKDGVTIFLITAENGNLNMTDKGQYCAISWTSDDQSVIALDGTISQPSYLDTQGEPQIVTLKASISYGAATGEKAFCVAIFPKATVGEEKKVEDVCIEIDDFLNKSQGFNRLDFLKEDFHLPVADSNNYCSISYTSSDSNWFNIESDDDGFSDEDYSFAKYQTGYVNRPSYTEGNKNITLTAKVQSKADSNVYKDMVFNVMVVACSPDDSESVALTKNWLTDTLVLNGSSADSVQNDLYVPEKYGVPDEVWQYKDCTIKWESSDSSVITADGKVLQPDEGTKSVTLTATISKGGAKDTKQFKFTVAAKKQSTLALKFDDFTYANGILQANGNGTSTGIDGSGKKLVFKNEKSGGSIFTINKIHLNDDLSFSTAFSFRINAIEDFGNYGDGGFTFTLQSKSSTAYYSGENTNSLGVYNVKPSVSIEFDTEYYKSEGSGQGNYYHAIKNLGVFVNGNTDSLIQASIYSTPFGLNLAAETVYYTWIEYNGAAKTLEIRVSGSQARPFSPTYKLENVDLTALLAANNHLSVGDVADVYAGFTGSAGDMTTETDDILRWYFKNDSTPINFNQYTYKDASVVMVSADANGNTGDCTISAAVQKSDGAPAADVPVTFSASAGTLASSSANTDSTGTASVILHTGESISGVELKAVAKGGMTGSAVMDLALTPQYVVDFDAKWLTDSLILNGNSSLDNVIADLSLPTQGKTLYNDGGSDTESTISWVSSNEKYLTNDGKVTNPAPKDGESDG